MKFDIKTFEIFLNASGIKFKKEHGFSNSKKWRFDYLILPEEDKIAIEIEGGEFIRGRHQRPGGFKEDCYKYNCATSVGWRVLRYTYSMLDENPDQVLVDIMFCRTR